MKSLKLILNNLKSDESGQDLIEYALVAALVGLGAVTSMKTLANVIGNALRDDRYDPHKQRLTSSGRCRWRRKNPARTDLYAQVAAAADSGLPLRAKSAALCCWFSCLPKMPASGQLRRA